MEEKLVSILIPCYNAEKYLGECLRAILNQSYQNIEVIIVNDGSTDNSEKIIDKYTIIFKKTRKRIIKINQSNQGQAAACNNGLKKVRGYYFYWQDADDVLEDDAISILVDFLENHTECDLVRGNVAYRDEKKFDLILNIGKPINPLEHNIFNEYLYEKGTYCFCGIFMVRMSHFDKSNPNRELYISSGGQNYQILLPILYKAKCGYVDKIIYNYRIIDSSHSHSIQTKKDKIKRCNVHEDIVIKTLKLINRMPDKEKKYYINHIKIKYLKRKVMLLIPQPIKRFFKKVNYARNS